MDKRLGFYQKYNEIILYIFFGILTTGVNFAVYFLLKFTPMYYATANVVAWAASVFFAFATNRKYVFRMGRAPIRALARELAVFASCRAFSGALDTGILILFVEMLSMNDMVVKVISGVVVVVINYVFSKLVIFKK